MESSPHCPVISSQLQKPVNLTNSPPLILSHSVSSVPLKFCSSLFQSTTDSSWICQSRHYFTHAPPMAPHCPWNKTRNSCPGLYFLHGWPLPNTIHFTSSFNPLHSQDFSHAGYLSLSKPWGQTCLSTSKKVWGCTWGHSKGSLLKHHFASQEKLETNVHHNSMTE